MVFLKSQPSLLPACIETVDITWDQPSFSVVAGLNHLTYLLNNVSVSYQQRVVKTAVYSTDANHRERIFESVISSMIPLGLSKKELTKLLSQSNYLLLNLGLSFMATLIKRYEGVFRDALLMKQQIAYVNFIKIFPDLHSFISLRGRFALYLKLSL